MRALVWNPLSCCPLVTAFYSRVLRPGGQVLFTACGPFQRGQHVPEQILRQRYVLVPPLPLSCPLSLSPLSLRFSPPCSPLADIDDGQPRADGRGMGRLAERARRAVELGSGADAGCRGLFYMGGEGPLGGTPQGFVADLAREFGAVLVAIEHRCDPTRVQFCVRCVALRGAR
jgi:hypothetical protein